jgi:hypothetical protein
MLTVRCYDLAIHDAHAGQRGMCQLQGGGSHDWQQRLHLLAWQRMWLLLVLCLPPEWV